MATIYSSDHIGKLIRMLKLAPSRDKIPNELAEKILPVYQLNYPYDINTRVASLNNGTSTTIMTTAADKETYVTGLTFGYIKDATSTSTLMAIRAAPFGQATPKELVAVPGITLTAAEGNFTMTFPIPIRIQPNTNITLNSDTAVANIKLTGTIHYYEVSNT